MQIEDGPHISMYGESAIRQTTSAVSIRLMGQDARADVYLFERKPGSLEASKNE